MTDRSANVGLTSRSAKPSTVVRFLDAIEYPEMKRRLPGPPVAWLIGLVVVLGLVWMAVGQAMGEDRWDGTNNGTVFTLFGSFLAVLVVVVGTLPESGFSRSMRFLHRWDWLSHHLMGTLGLLALLMLALMIVATVSSGSAMDIGALAALVGLVLSMSVLFTQSPVLIGLVSTRRRLQGAIFTVWVSAILMVVTIAIPPIVWFTSSTKAGDAATGSTGTIPGLGGALDAGLAVSLVAVLISTAVAVTSAFVSKLRGIDRSIQGLMVDLDTIRNLGIRPTGTESTAAFYEAVRALQSRLDLRPRALSWGSSRLVTSASLLELCRLVDAHRTRGPGAAETYSDTKVRVAAADVLLLPTRRLVDEVTQVADGVLQQIDSTYGPPRHDKRKKETRDLKTLIASDDGLPMRQGD